MHHDDQQRPANLSPYCTKLFSLTDFLSPNPQLQKEKKSRNSESLTAPLQPFAKTVSRMLKRLERNASHPNSLISTIPHFQNTWTNSFHYIVLRFKSNTHSTQTQSNNNIKRTSKLEFHVSDKRIEKEVSAKQ